MARTADQTEEGSECPAVVHAAILAAGRLNHGRSVGRPAGCAGRHSEERSELRPATCAAAHSAARATEASRLRQRRRELLLVEKGGNYALRAQFR